MNGIVYRIETNLLNSEFGNVTIETYLDEDNSEVAISAFTKEMMDKGDYWPMELDKKELKVYIDFLQSCLWKIEANEKTAKPDPNY